MLLGCMNWTDYWTEIGTEFEKADSQVEPAFLLFSRPVEKPYKPNPILNSTQLWGSTSPALRK